MENSLRKTKKEEKNNDDDDESLNIKVYKYILYDVYDHDVLIIKLNKNQEICGPCYDMRSTAAFRPSYCFEGFLTNIIKNQLLYVVFIWFLVHSISARMFIYQVFPGVLEELLIQD